MRPPELAGAFCRGEFALQIMLFLSAGLRRGLGCSKQSHHNDRYNPACRPQHFLSLAADAD